MWSWRHLPGQRETQLTGRTPPSSGSRPTDFVRLLLVRAALILLLAAMIAMRSHHAAVPHHTTTHHAMTVSHHHHLAREEAEYSLLRIVEARIKRLGGVGDFLERCSGLH